MPVPLPIEAKLPEEIPQCHALIREMERDIVQYQTKIDYLTRRLFGRRSERMEAGELTFFGEVDPAVGDAKEETPATTSDSAAETPVQPSRRNGRRPLPKELPHKRIEHDVPAEQKICSECGCEKKRIGEETSERLEYIPASLYVIEDVRLKYACPHCQGHVVIGEKPPQPIEKGMAGPGLLAHVITSKYCDHLPLHRQEAMFARHGVDLSRKTLCDWMMQSAAVLEPVVRDKGTTHRAYLWVYMGDLTHPYTIYDFTWTRNRDWPKQFLGPYKGHLQADAFSGYEDLYTDGTIFEVGCWAHARRKFFDAKTTAPVAANETILRIKPLYEIEARAKGLKVAERLALREREAVPRLEQLATWLSDLQKTALPKSPISQAIEYTLNNWTALTRYAHDALLDIDNNPAERALRRVVVGRNNWLFAGSQRGGEAAATLFSLIASAKQNSLDPFAYLRDLLTRIPTHPQRDIAQLFPDRWKALSPQAQ